MSPIYTGDKLGFGVAPSTEGGGGAHIYNNAGMVFTNAGAYGNAGPTNTMMQYEYKDQKFWTENHYFTYTDPSTTYTDGGFIFVRTPQSGAYTFRIRGAFGGPSPDWNSGANKGGSPWYMEGTVNLVGGRWIGIIVGQHGGEVRDSVNSGGGGGGGTFLIELDGSESQTTLTNSYIESASVTCLLVAAGGNGANWESWNSEDVPARDETATGATDWILGAINYGNNWGYDIFGRGAFGGSFNYTPYSTVNVHNAAGADAPWYNNYGSTAGMEKRSGMPILDSSNKISNKSGLGGVHWNTNDYNQRYNNANRDPNSSSHGGIGGFGGGAASYYEGGGGGGYWGGAAWQENQYSTTYNYGAQSYAHPTRATVELSRVYGDGGSGYGDSLMGLDMYARASRNKDGGPVMHEFHGKLYLCPKEPKATAIGEAVFHADGCNVGEDQNGVGKVTKYDWYVPQGVTSISVVSVGGGGGGCAVHDGGGGGGGSLAYKNNIAVTPGQKITVQVGCGGWMRWQNASSRSPKGTDSKITVHPVGSGGGGGGSSHSVKFNGGNDYLTIGASNQLSMGTGDFTIECWARFDDTSNRGLWQLEGLTTNHTTTLSFAHNGSNWHGYRGGSTWDYGGSRTANQWYHCAYVRHQGQSTVYLDGTALGSWSDSYNYGGTTLALGGYYTTGYLMNGNISNFRIVKGTAVYTSGNNFTPPTSALTNISGTVLLCCNQSSATGSSVTPATILNGQGSATASGEHPFSGGGGSSGTDYAEAGGGYGIYASGQSCASSQNDANKGMGGTYNTSNSDGGGDGGNGMQYSGCRQGGGGAGGYNGQGKTQSGYPSNHNYSGCSGAGGAGGGGGGGAGSNSSSPYYSGGGGGVGIYGQGADGSKGDSNNNGSPDQALDFAGRGGSENYGTGNIAYTSQYNANGGANGGNFIAEGTRGGMTGYNRYRAVYASVTGTTPIKGPDGGFPGGGGGGGHGSDIWGMGGHGVVRIVWGAPTGYDYRSFPSSVVDISTTYDSDADVFRIGTQTQY